MRLASDGSRAVGGAGRLCVVSPIGLAPLALPTPAHDGAYLKSGTIAYNDDHGCSLWTGAHVLKLSDHAANVVRAGGGTIAIASEGVEAVTGTEIHWPDGTIFPDDPDHGHGQIVLDVSDDDVVATTVYQLGHDITLRASTGPLVVIPTGAIDDDAVAGKRVRLRGDVLYWKELGVPAPFLRWWRTQMPVPYVARPDQDQVDEACPVPLTTDVTIQLERSSSLTLRDAMNPQAGWRVNTTGGMAPDARRIDDTHIAVTWSDDTAGQHPHYVVIDISLPTNVTFPLVPPAPTFAPIPWPILMGPYGRVTPRVMDTGQITAFLAANGRNPDLDYVYSDRARGPWQNADPNPDPYLCLTDAQTWADRLGVWCLANFDNGPDAGMLAQCRTHGRTVPMYEAYLRQWPTNANADGAAFLADWSALLADWDGPVAITAQGYLQWHGTPLVARAAVDVVNFFYVTFLAMGRAGARCVYVTVFGNNRADGYPANPILDAGVRAFCAAAGPVAPIFLSGPPSSPISGGLMLTPGLYTIGIVNGQIAFTPAVPALPPFPIAPSPVVAPPFASYGDFLAALTQVQSHRTGAKMGHVDIDAWRLLVENPGDVNAVIARI